MSSTNSSNCIPHYIPHGSARTPIMVVDHMCYLRSLHICADNNHLHSLILQLAVYVCRSFINAHIDSISLKRQTTPATLCARWHVLVRWRGLSADCSAPGRRGLAAPWCASKPSMQQWYPHHHGIRVTLLVLTSTTKSNAMVNAPTALFWYGVGVQQSTTARQGIPAYQAQ